MHARDLAKGFPEFVLERQVALLSFVFGGGLSHLQSPPGLVKLPLHGQKTSGIVTRSGGGRASRIQFLAGSVQLVGNRTDHGIGPLLLKQKSLPGKAQIFTRLLEFLFQSVDLLGYRLGSRRTAVFGFPQGLPRILQFLHHHLRFVEIGLQGNDFTVSLSQIPLQASRIGRQLGLDGFGCSQLVFEPPDHILGFLVQYTLERLGADLTDG